MVCLHSVGFGGSWTFTVIFFNVSRGSTLFVSLYVSFALVTHDESFALQFIIVSSVTFLYPRSSPFFMQLQINKYIQNTKIPVRVATDGKNDFCVFRNCSINSGPSGCSKFLECFRNNH